MRIIENAVNRSDDNIEAAPAVTLSKLDTVLCVVEWMAAARGFSLDRRNFQLCILKLFLSLLDFMIEITSNNDWIRTRFFFI
jgi:hypothetical protein